MQAQLKRYLMEVWDTVNKSIEMIDRYPVADPAMAEIRAHLIDAQYELKEALSKLPQDNAPTDGS